MGLRQFVARNRLITLLAFVAALTAALSAQDTKPAPGPTTRRPTAADPAAKLRAALPAGWTLQGSFQPKPKAMNPGLHWTRVPARYVKLTSRLILTKDGLQREAPPVIVWLANQQAKKTAPRVSDRQQDVELKPTEHLGLGSGRHVYLHMPPAAVKLWPTARRDIAAAMGVKLATTQPADTSKEGSVITVTLNGSKVSYMFNGIWRPDIKSVSKAMARMPKDAPLIIRIATGAPYRSVAEILAAAQKLQLTKVLVTVVRTSRPTSKHKSHPPTTRVR